MQIKGKENFLYRGAGTIEMYIIKIATIHEIIKIVFFPCIICSAITFYHISVLKVPSINDITHLGGRRGICQKVMLLHKPIY